MYKVLCEGAGIYAKGIRFVNGKMYTVSDEVVEYMEKTFPGMLVKIEKIKSKEEPVNTVKEQKEEKPKVKRTRRNKKAEE